ncbi:MAG: hypothetical protein NTW52_13945, partial [Planctomycetota bacterium]|nr:hypothetical protein [Planctomycetota bacterium]
MLKSVRILREFVRKRRELWSAVTCHSFLKVDVLAVSILPPLAKPTANAPESHARKLRQVGALQIWSAVTSHSFLKVDVLAVSILPPPAKPIANAPESHARKLRQVGALQRVVLAVSILPPPA